MPELHLSDPALADLRNIRRYIAKDDPVAAKRFIGELVALCEKLAEMPRMGRERPDIAEGVRAFPMNRYLVVYRITDNGVEILHVVHSARDIGLLFQ